MGQLKRPPSCLGDVLKVAVDPPEVISFVSLKLTGHTWRLYLQLLLFLQSIRLSTRISCLRAYCVLRS